MSGAPSRPPACGCRISSASGCGRRDRGSRRDGRGRANVGDARIVSIHSSSPSPRDTGRAGTSAAVFGHHARSPSVSGSFRKSGITGASRTAADPIPSTRVSPEHASRPWAPGEPPRDGVLARPDCVDLRGRPRLRVGRGRGHSRQRDRPRRLVRVARGGPRLAGDLGVVPLHARASGGGRARTGFHGDGSCARGGGLDRRRLAHASRLAAPVDAFGRHVRRPVNSGSRMRRVGRARRRLGVGRRLDFPVARRRYRAAERTDEVLDGRYGSLAAVHPHAADVLSVGMPPQPQLRRQGGVHVLVDRGPAPRPARSA